MRVTGRRVHQRPLVIAVFSAMIVVGALWALQLVRGQPANAPFTATKTESIWFDDNLRDEWKDEVDSFFGQQKQHLKMAASAKDASIVIGPKKEGYQTWPVETAVGGPQKLSGDTIIAKTTAPLFYVNAKNEALVKKLASNLTAAAAKQNPEWKLTTAGDIIIGRTVYQKVRNSGDPNKPLSLFAAQLGNADLTLANVENAFAHQASYPTSGMSFVAPPSFADGLKSAGIDAVNLANNHSYNAGAEGFTETLATLKKLGIGTFGGGANTTDARKPLIKEAKGVKVALLGYSSIVGSEAAGPNRPGQNTLQMAPWGKLQENELQQMEADIKAAKAQANMVLIYYHWGQEYTHQANDDQRTVAHRAIDAGADMIIGSHPHWVQGVELYKNKFIAYSLGNFVFDQEWSTETKQGFFIEFTMAGTQLVAAKLVPYQIEDYYQPRPPTAVIKDKILKDAYSHSWWQVN